MVYRHISPDEAFLSTHNPFYPIWEWKCDNRGLSYYIKCPNPTKCWENNKLSRFFDKCICGKRKFLLT